MNENDIIRLVEHMGRCYRRSFAPMDTKRVEAIRSVLVQELNSASQVPAPAVRAPLLQFNFASLFHLHLLRPVLAVLVLGIFATGSLLKIASASLPGDALYTVKLAREQVQVRLTVDKNERAKLAVQFAVNRADEVRRVVAGAESRERKAENVAVAVAGLNTHVATATDTLATMSDKKELAAVVEEGAGQIVSLLRDAKDSAEANNGVVMQEVTKALSDATETKELVELASNPPVELVMSVPIESVVRVAAFTPEPLLKPALSAGEGIRGGEGGVMRGEAGLKMEKMSGQSSALLNPAQSVSSLPFVQSMVNVSEELPLAVSVGSKMAESVQSAQ